MTSIRPTPPESITDQTAMPAFEPAPAVLEWVQTQIIDSEGALHNPDHNHLEHADLGFLWTNVECVTKGRLVLGMTEQPTFRCNRWQKARQELQIEDWFGRLPDFIITLDAHYCAQADDVDFCALVEHELYHCAQATDEFGMPKFNSQTGQPVFVLRGHDVEEFVGVVKRYGVGRESGELAQLVEAANSQPEINGRSIASACGTCIK